ncbi:MAG: hypothetical protein ABIO70_08650 [Pseudomonadota bacterium]
MTDTPPPTPGAITMLFSGGLDTTLEVVELAEAGHRLHLVTFDNGRCVNRGGARRRFLELQGRYGDLLVHAEIDTSALMDQLVARARQAPRRLKSPLAVDMACKMAAVTQTLAYTRRAGVEVFSDGAAIDQTQVFIQHPEFSQHIRPLLERHGVRYRPPVRFDWPRERKIARLEELGLASGPPVLEHLHITSQLAHQPFCMRGFVTFLFTSPTRHLPPFKQLGLPMERAKELWTFLLPDAEAWLARELQA